MQSTLLETQGCIRHKSSFQGAKDTREAMAKLDSSTSSTRLKVLNAMRQMQKMMSLGREGSRGRRG